MQEIRIDEYYNTVRSEVELRASNIHYGLMWVIRDGGLYPASGLHSPHLWNRPCDEGGWMTPETERLDGIVLGQHEGCTPKDDKLDGGRQLR